MKFRWYMQSTVGRQQVFALTGLLSVVLTFIYLGKDLCLYSGPRIYNVVFLQTFRSWFWSYFVWSLLLLFVLAEHLMLFFQIRKINQSARPQGYKIYLRRKPTDRLPVVSVLGVFFIVSFLSWHWLHLGGGRLLAQVVAGQGLNGDFYHPACQFLSDPFSVGIYFYSIVILATLFVHYLRHSVQTLGFFYPPHSPDFRRGSFLAGLLLLFVYGLLPFYILKFLAKG